MQDLQKVRNYYISIADRDAISNISNLLNKGIKPEEEANRIKDLIFEKLVFANSSFYDNMVLKKIIKNFNTVVNDTNYENFGFRALEHRLSYYRDNGKEILIDITSVEHTCIWNEFNEEVKDYLRDLLNSIHYSISFSSDIHLGKLRERFRQQNMQQEEFLEI